MICQRCGAENDDDGQFCYNCGTRLEKPAPVSAVSYAPPPPPIGQAVPPQPYPIQYTNYAPAAPSNSTAALLSLIFGIVAWTVLPLIGAFGAIICGHIARNEIRQSAGRVGGNGMAVAGLVLGYIQVVLTILGCIAFALFFLFVAAVAAA